MVPKTDYAGQDLLSGTDMHRMDYRKPEIDESFQWLVNHLDGLKLHGLLREMQRM